MKRPSSPDTSDTKRPETSKKTPSQTSFSSEEIISFFNQQIFTSEFQSELKQNVAQSQPYKWGLFLDLINDKLLRNVRQEVTNEISFSEKETDIYKVYQSGDLANLSGLDWSDLSRLPSLFKLRAGLYSQEFRDVVSNITGCGKLSGIKTDMSLNTYTSGCHLLPHDDVIGSRRVSFILYLPDPDKLWKLQYGGGLRLFPAIVPNVPATDFHSKLSPQFNQMAFFTVQPGLSFHDVEEVRVDKQRISIQGWFHIPQPGEDGFIPGEQEATESRSTLQQLQSKELQEYDFPKPYRTDLFEDELQKYRTEMLNDDDIEYLSQFLNPAYVKKNVWDQLGEVFLEESVVEIKHFLRQDVAEGLQKAIKHTEVEFPVPESSKHIEFPWKCAVPPHKQRYMYIDGKKHVELTQQGINHHNNIVGNDLPNFDILSNVKLEETDAKLIEIAQFLQSISFKKWLKVITSLIPTSEQLLIRRFRPGHDYMLATTTEKSLARGPNEANVLLEATLGLTPTAAKNHWELGQYGGYELCMALDNEEGEDDPAIYKPSDPNDDSVLYSSQCQWNSLTLMVRDPSVLKFIKYVSVNAGGSRWDVLCQWNVEDNS